jgi:hypothetical protein
MEANNWVTLRFYDFDDTLPELLPTATWTNGEYMAKGIGFSGNDEIFVGFKPYYNRVRDYFNLNYQCQLGFADTLWTNQVGRQAFSIGTHNLELEYFINCNPQRICGTIKMNTNYQHFYVGKYNSYLFPHEYPYPVYVCGTHGENSDYRYSARTGHPYREYQTYSRVRNNSDWVNTYPTYPFNISNLYYDGQSFNEGIVKITPTTYNLNTQYTLFPAHNYVGEYDGIYWVSGYNLQAEDTITVGAKTFVCLPIATLRSFGNYIALAME